MTPTRSRTTPAASPDAFPASGEALPGRVLDPRTGVVLLLTASIAIMAPGGLWYVPATLVAGVLLAVVERAWKRVLGLPAAAALAAAVAFLLPAAAPWPVLGVVGVTAEFTLRLIAVGGIAVHLVRTIPPTRFTAALRAARVPSAFTVSGAVMLRFAPTIVSEAQAVRDAMRLRGLGGWAAMLRRPLRAIEYFTVPLMASSLRAAEDLSASALLRGLGSEARPTAMHPPRLGPMDAAAAVVAVLLAVATLVWRAAA